MQHDIILTKFLNQLRKNAIKQSLVAAIVTALLVLFFGGTVSWYFGLALTWQHIPCFIGTTGASAILFYFLKYRKSGVAAAREIDKLGLEERVLTMEHLKNSDSYIARRQREDTLTELARVDKQYLLRPLTTTLTICLAVALPLGVSSAITSTLAAEGVLPTGREVTAQLAPNYSLIYSAAVGGSLEGKVTQRVAAGKEGSYVIAQADDGYIFIKWSDGVRDAARRDIPANTDIELEAIFAKLSDYNPDEELLKPGNKNGNKGEGEQSNPDAPPSDSSSPNEYPSKDPSDGSGAGGGESDAPANQIIDGETFYGDKPYDDAYQDATDRLNGDSDLSDSDKGLIGSYFDAIGR